MEGKETVRTTGNRLAMFLLGATLALGFALSAYMLSTALVRMRQTDVIRVKGLAEARVKSNFATWYCKFWYRSPQVASGYEGLEKSRNAILEFLKAQKVAEGEMGVNPIHLETLYKSDEKGNRTNTIESVGRAYLPDSLFNRWGVSGMYARPTESWHSR